MMADTGEKRGRVVICRDGSIVLELAVLVEGRIFPYYDIPNKPERVTIGAIARTKDDFWICSIQGVVAEALKQRDALFLALKKKGWSTI